MTFNQYDRKVVVRFPEHRGVLTEKMVRVTLFKTRIPRHQHIGICIVQTGTKLFDRWKQNSCHVFNAQHLTIFDEMTDMLSKKALNLLS